MSKRLAVVTGATGGIGGAVVQRLHTAGYAVIACGRHPTRLHALATMPEVSTLGYDLATMSAHVLHQFFPDTIHLLVCAHGHTPILSPSADVSAHDFRAVYDVDVLGTLKMAQAVYPSMRTQGGSMVFVSSLHARQSYPARAAYASAKAAVCGLMRTLALEWAGHGIRVNAVLPWQVQGPRGDALAAGAAAMGEDLIEAYKQRSPLRRLITAEDVAESVLFLAHNTACNGMELVLDGGVSSSMWYQPFRAEHAQ